MSDLVEAVARAIAIALDSPATAKMIYDAQGNGLPIPVAALEENIARAVIPVVLEHLREPTPAMLDAFVSRALQVSIDGEGGWSNYGRNQWQAMFEAAIRGLGEP